jgi:hypothetical protein
MPTGNPDIIPVQAVRSLDSGAGNVQATLQATLQNSCTVLPAASGNGWCPR